MIPAVKNNQKKNFWFRFPSDQSGSVLILVVWMITLFSFWVMSAAASGIFSLNVDRRIEGDMKAYALARSAIPHVQKILEDDETPKHDGGNESLFVSKDLYEPQSLGEGSFEIFYDYPNPYTGYLEKKQGILDEERKLNLNTIDTDILERLLRAFVDVKDDKEDAMLKSLVASILDWRDADNDRQDGGAEKFEYMVLKEFYDCKNGPFESLDELLLVKGMKPEILKKIEPYLTVYSSGKVNINTAPDAVLRALGFSEGGVSGILAFRIGLDGEIGTADDGVIDNIKAVMAEFGSFLAAEDGNRVTRLLKNDMISIDSQTFSFTSEGRLESYPQSTFIDVIMKRDGEVVSWRER